MRRLTLRARVLLVVALVALLPLPVVWLAGTVDVLPDLRANTSAAADEIALALRQNDRARVAAIARDRAVWARVYDGDVLTIEHFYQRHDSLWHRSSAAFLGPGATPSLRENDLRSSAVRDGVRCEIVASRKLAVCVASRSSGARTIIVQDGWPRIIRALNDQRFALLKVTLFTLGPAMLLAAWLLRRIVPPIETLREQVSARMATTEPAPIDFERDDELGELARSFNALLQTLSSRRAAHRDFVADLAHELKNPAATVRACAESLDRATPLDAERSKRVAAALEESARRITGLVDGMLALARAEAGLSGEARSDVALASLVAGIVASMEDDPRYAMVRFECASESDAIVRAVPERVESALRNVLENAASFAGENGWVKARVFDDGDVVCVQVDDSGPGIDATNLPRVFERFFTTRGDRSHGTGLGLALARAVIEAHGGTIVAQSPPSQGARFVIRLPR